MAAQDAELKLKVSLDLAFFRQQLAGLGQAAAGYNMPINVKLDRSAITKELRNLERAIGKKKINVELNLLGGLTKDQLEKIQGRLEALSKTKKVEIPVSVKNGATGRDIQDTITGIRQRIAANQQIRQGSGKLRIPTSIKPSITNADVSEFKKAVQQKLSGISVKVKAEVERGFAAGPTGAAGLFEYMRSQGLSGGNVPQATEVGRSERLKKALNDLTVKQLQALAKEQGIGGVSKMRKDPLIEKLVAELNQDIAENILGNIKNQLRDVGKGPLKSVLDTFARGLFNMLGMDAASMRRQMAERRTLPPVSFPATIPPRSFPIGPSSTGRVLPAGRTAAGLIGAAQAPAGLLPSITARSSIKSGVDALFAAGGPQFPMGASGKLALSTEALRARVDQILSDYFKIAEVTVKEIFNPQDLKRALNIFSYLPQALKDAETRTRQARVGIPSAQGIAGLLPAARGRAPSTYSTGAIGGETREQMMARRTAEAYARSALRGMDVMGGGAGRPPSPYSYAYRSARPTSALVPYAAGGAMVPVPSMAGGGGAVPPGGGGGGGFGGMGGDQFRNLMGFGPSASPINFSLFQQSRLPLSGAVRELGEEFGFAVKQVLLFGTAYKALAFLTNLPGEAFEAAKALANYRNQLDAVTSESGTFERSFAFVDNLAARFNVPLESARQGFVKLYASMEPAGFGSGQIENLFEGISKATAAFGLSADKVDRVNYAFAQMASKGQIMSEELKGQLGDVLPGALALFAEAAQMSIPEFSQAMEDGAFKGEAMQQVLDNVAVLMNNKFGPAAQNASKTLQGALNQIQNNLKVMYESMSPIVNQIAAIFSPQINALINDLTSTVKALTGNFAEGSDVVSTLSPRAEALYSAFQQIVPSVAAAAQNIGNFVSSLQILVGPLLGVTKGMLDFISIPFVARVGLYATIVASLNAAFQLLAKTGIAQATVALVRFLATLNIAQINAYIAGIRTVIAVLASMVNAARIATAAVVGLKVALGLAFATAVITGLDMLAQRVFNIGAAADSSKKSVREFAQELDRIAGSADVESATKAYMDANTELAKARKENAKALADLRKAQEAPSGSLGLNVLEAQRKADEAYAKVIEANTKMRQARQARDTAVRRQEESRSKVQQQLKPIDLSAGDEKDKKDKRTPLKQILDLESQRQAEMALSDKMRRLSKLITDAKLSGNEAEAESLENLSKALEISSKIQAAQKFLIMLIEKEGEIVGKSLTQKEFTNKLEDARVELYKLQNDLQVEFDKLQVKEAGAAKKAVDELAKKIEKQKELNRLIEDAQIAAGVISPQQAAIIQQQRGFEDARARVEAEGTPEQLAQLTAAQALIPQAGSIQEYIKGLRDELQQLISVQNLAAVSARGIGEALGDAMTNGVASLISGTATAKEVFASFLQSVGQALSQAASQMIATYIAIGIAKAFAGLAGGGGGADYSGGKVATGAFNTDSLGMGPSLSNWNWEGAGFTPFANGGVVSGPTLGLIGEGKYNEAVVPLPDGRSIPVQLGGRSARDMMGSNAPGMPQAPSLSMKFETTKINGVEYVSREQLEQAMAETRRASIAGGAKQGMSMTLDKIKQSPSTRSRIGIR